MDHDDAYANVSHIPGAADYPPRWRAAARAWAAEWAATGRCCVGLSYGPGARHRFDLFQPAGSPRGLVVFVHGGYWLKFDCSMWSHLAAGALMRGWAVALPSYDLCPDVRISAITRQVAQAVTAAAGQVEGPLVLTGHSAGGHLVARMLEHGMLAPEVAARLAHVMPISPLSDLRPLLHTSMNGDLRLDAAEAAAESPRLMRQRLRVPVTVHVGAQERPAFLDQARWLAAAWQAGHVIAPGRHHFDVIDDLCNPESAMVETLLG